MGAYFFKIFAVYVVCSFFTPSLYSCVDIVTFSFNRPMQLYALLESIEKYAINMGELHVIYRADANFVSAYAEVKNRFKNVFFHRQGNQPYSDFKPLTLQMIFQSPHKYVACAVDDIVVTDYINFEYCTHLLETTGAYGFYLRLGKNITQSYRGAPMGTPVPKCCGVTEDVHQFVFADGLGDWGYPHTVDLTIYKKSDIASDFHEMNFHNPNVLEGEWSQRSNKHKSGLFYDSSKMVNFPMNLVNESWTNPYNNSFSTQELLDLFNNGLKIDIDYFYQLKNSCPHSTEEPHFTKR